VDGRTGFLADTDEELAQALRRLLEEQTLRVTMGELALQHAALFDWDEAAAKWQEAFAEVVAKMGRGPAFRGVRLTVPANGITVKVPRSRRQKTEDRAQKAAADASSRAEPAPRKLANY
jgi:hypothetical protein